LLQQHGSIPMKHAHYLACTLECSFLLSRMLVFCPIIPFLCILSLHVHGVWVYSLRCCSTNSLITHFDQHTWAAVKINDTPMHNLSLFFCIKSVPLQLHFLLLLSVLLIQPYNIMHIGYTSHYICCITIDYLCLCCILTLLHYWTRTHLFISSWSLWCLVDETLDCLQWERRK